MSDRSDNPSHHERILYHGDTSHFQTGRDRLFPLVASANQGACTLCVAMRTSVGTSDWTIFDICIQNICLIWEDWHSLFLLIYIQWQSSHKELSNGVRHAGVL